MIVESTGNVDDLTSVQFYTSDDCSSGTELSEADTGCITIADGFIGPYKSWRVMEDNIFQTKSRRKRQIRRQLAGNLGPSYNATPKPTQPASPHGQLAPFDGIQYRWQQISSDGFIGILPSEWNDEVHIQNTTVLPDLPSSYDPMFLRARELNQGLDERALLQGLCDVRDTCNKGLNGASTMVKDAAAPYFSAALKVAKDNGEPVLKFLNDQPFLAQIAASIYPEIPSYNTPLTLTNSGAHSSSQCCLECLCRREGDREHRKPRSLLFAPSRDRNSTTTDRCAHFYTARIC